MNDRFIFFQITKYASLLALFNLLSYGFMRGWTEFQVIRSYSDNFALLAVVPFAVNGVLNLIMALLINQDIRKHQVKTKYITLATMVYRPIGVIAYLLFLFLQERNTGSAKSLPD